MCRKRRVCAAFRCGEYVSSAVRRMAATPRPVQLKFDRMPSAEALRREIEATIKDNWFDDVHGSAPYKRRLTYYYAEQIREELAAK